MSKRKSYLRGIGSLFISFSKNIKDHLAILFLIPSVIGGIWQILELMNISFYHVRFFSVTQLISDGLIIMITLSFWFIVIRIPYNMIFEGVSQAEYEEILKKKLLKDEDDEDDEDLLKKPHKTIQIYRSVYFILIIYLIYKSGVIDSLSFMSFTEFFRSCFYIIIYGIIIRYIIINIDNAFKLEDYINAHKIKGFLVLVITLIPILIPILYMGKKIDEKLEDVRENKIEKTTSIHELSLNKFYNTKLIKQKVKNKVGSDVRIKYFNDQHVFINYYGKDSIVKNLVLDFNTFITPDLSDNLEEILITQNDSLLEEIDKNKFEIQALKDSLNCYVPVK